MRRLLLPLLLSLLQLLSILFILVATFFCAISFAILSLFISSRYIWHSSFCCFLIPSSRTTKKLTKSPWTYLLKVWRSCHPKSDTYPHSGEYRAASGTHGHTLVQRDFLLVTVCVQFGVRRASSSFSSSSSFPDSYILFRLQKGWVGKRKHRKKLR